MPSPESTVFITGSTSGLGLAAATRLAREGHTVVLHGRNAERAKSAVGTVKDASGSEKIHAVTGDLSRLESVRALSAEVVERFGGLNVFIANAAMSNWGHASRTETEDGHEFFFATNYLSHYLLTRSLLPTLVGNAPARVVLVGARQMGAKLDFDDLQLTRKWSGMRAITQAKLGMFCLTRALAERFAADTLRAVCLDPGLVDTAYQAKANFVLKLALKIIGKKPEKVAELYSWLAAGTEPAPVSGQMYTAPNKASAWKGQITDDSVVERCWTESARLCELPESLDQDAG